MKRLPPASDDEQKAVAILVKFVQTDSTHRVLSVWQWLRLQPIHTVSPDAYRHVHICVQHPLKAKNTICAQADASDLSAMDLLSFQSSNSFLVYQSHAPRIVFRYLMLQQRPGSREVALRYPLDPRALEELQSLGAKSVVQIFHFDVHVAETQVIQASTRDQSDHPKFQYRVPLLPRGDVDSLPAPAIEPTRHASPVSERPPRLLVKDAVEPKPSPVVPPATIAEDKIHVLDYTVPYATTLITILAIVVCACFLLIR